MKDKTKKTMKLLNYNKVLVLSPHPDDAEYGMLGAMGIYKDTQFDVFVLSEGGDFDESTNISRHNETRKVLFRKFWYRNTFQRSCVFKRGSQFRKV